MERFSCCKTARGGQGLLWMAQKNPLNSRIFSWLAMSNWLPSPLGVFPARAGSRSFPLASSLIHCTLRRSALIYVGCVHSKAPGNVQLRLPYHQGQWRSEHSEWCQNCCSYFLNYFYEKQHFPPFALQKIKHTACCSGWWGRCVGFSCSSVQFKLSSIHFDLQYFAANTTD